MFIRSCFRRYSPDLDHLKVHLQMRNVTKEEIFFSDTYATFERLILPVKMSGAENLNHVVAVDFSAMGSPIVNLIPYCGLILSVYHYVLYGEPRPKHCAMLHSSVEMKHVLVCIGCKVKG